MPELLGEHENIARDLHNRVKALSDGSYDGPNVVMLRGASGVGKTAIIQRLYELLRFDNVEKFKDGYAQYWPELTTADSESDPLRGRAILSPDLDSFIWKEGALPTFGWWSFNCEELRNNQKLDVVATAKKQMETHLVPLSLAWWNASGALARTGKVLSEVVPQVRKDLQSNAADSLIENSLDALSIGIPLPATLTSWLIDVFRWFGKRLKDSKNLHRDVDLGEQHLKSKKSAGAELAEAIRSLTAKGLPGVIVIEDMHLMGPELRSLLTALSEPDLKRPVMVIGTVWPEGMAEDDFTQWHSDLQDNSDSQAQLLDVHVPSLQEDSLVELLLRYAPKTSTDVAKQVVEKLNTPLFLLLWITDPNVATEIRLSGHKILLSEEFKLPDSIEQVVENRWKAIPEGVRNALTAAVAGNPLDPDLDILNRFVPTIIAEVVNEIYQEPHENVHDAINKARNPIGWCKGATGVAYFADPLLTRHVRKTVRDLSVLKMHAQRFAQQACTHWLDNQREHLKLPSSSQVDAVVDWYLNFCGEELSLTTAAAHIHAAKRNIVAYEFSKAIEHSNSALDALGEDAEECDKILILRQIADCYYAMSEFTDAEAILSQLLPLQIKLYGQSHPDTLAVKLLHARLLLRSGDPLEAMPVLDDITLMFQASYSAEAVPTDVMEAVYIPLVTLKGDVAFESWAYGDAIELYEQGIGVATQIFGEDSPRTLMIQMKRLRAINARNPSSDEAFDQGKTLLTRIREAFGEDSPAALEVESNVIFFGYQANRIKDIEQTFRDLDARVSESEVYATLRADMYTWAGDIALNEGRFTDAHHWLSACLSIVNRHHGVYDPLSLRAAHQLGIVLFQLKQYDEAQSVIETLIENACIAVGATGNSTVQAEILLSLIYQIQGRGANAFMRLKRVRAELASDLSSGSNLADLVDARLRELNGGMKYVEFYPLVQMENGRFGRLSGTGVGSDPFWFIEGEKAFPEIVKQTDAIRHAEIKFDCTPEDWAFYLGVLSRAYMNLGSCHWRLGNIDEADKAFGTADKCVKLFFSKANHTGSIPPDSEMAAMASRGLAVSINLIGMLISLNLTSDMRDVFEKNKERAAGLLEQLSNETPENLGNIDLRFLEQTLSGLILS
ncbi:tetratricopeptide repeat protein [Rothia nasimurium]|uniref:tetratricopeptide repeat protein n=1 Tax=Rothia nasimurium TaxID=85336 RepID=UPI003B9F6D85